MVFNRLKDQNGGKVYQGAELNGCNDRAIEACKKQVLDDYKLMDDEMRTRLEWSDLSLLRSIFVYLDTYHETIHT